MEVFLRCIVIFVTFLITVSNAEIIVDDEESWVPNPEVELRMS